MSANAEKRAVKILAGHHSIGARGLYESLRDAGYPMTAQEFDALLLALSEKGLIVTGWRRFKHYWSSTIIYPSRRLRPPTLPPITP